MNLNNSQFFFNYQIKKINLKYIKIYILRNKKFKNQNINFLKIKPFNCPNYNFFGNEIRRSLLLNIFR
uniref:hypothetical protein n=1 Tax=Euglena longa TaxID=3037 RepID=UPI0000163758|nr:hypothetical protein AsloCp18 [Euglena longa]CAC24589.1 hypothetical protein [Euglena longa]